MYMYMHRKWPCTHRAQALIHVGCRLAHTACGQLHTRIHMNMQPGFIAAQDLVRLLSNLLIKRNNPHYFIVVLPDSAMGRARNELPSHYCCPAPDSAPRSGLGSVSNYKYVTVIIIIVNFIDKT